MEQAAARLAGYARIDLDALEHNVRAIKAHVGPNVQLFAVVKANAYGHGMIPVARAALRAGADQLAVARAEEGEALRRAGIDLPILVMGYTTDVDSVIAHNLTPTINSLIFAGNLSHAAQESGTTTSIHIKIDTGLGRFGLLPEEVLPFIERIAALPALHLEGVYTHFAAADSADKSYARQQFGHFLQVLDDLHAAGFNIPVKHACNSAATLDLLECHLDAVRVGVAMYGLHPSTELPPAVPLRPVLSLHSRIARLRTLPPGSSVGYGRTFVAERSTRAALIPIGYGDGYHRALSNRGMMLVRGARAPIIGRVSMDQTILDVTDIEGAREGDPVVLIGAQGDEYITAEEVGAWAGTINYEVTTSLLPRLPRVYVRGGEIVEIAQTA